MRKFNVDRNYPCQLYIYNKPPYYSFGGVIIVLPSNYDKSYVNLVEGFYYTIAGAELHSTNLN